MSDQPKNHDAPAVGAKEIWLFWGCFIALVTTAFGFIVRAFIIDEWAYEFNLSATERGQILGVGLWPFAVSIILFSLIIDKIGYGKAMVFAFVCHVASAIITVMAEGYWGLYFGTLIVALGNGTVEAVINPVVATMFPREKTKWLNILHAGWPGGLVLGGILAIFMGDVHWTNKVYLILIPTALYGLMMLGRSFPVHERVKAGVGYKAMLQEVGFVGAVIVSVFMMMEIGSYVPILTTIGFWPALAVKLGVALVLAVGYGLFVRSLGRPMFVFLMLIMVPLATTELGTDSWITSLMAPVMTNLGVNAGWILVYTSFIMMVLRFFAAPTLHKLSPLALLATSALIAAIGLTCLSKFSGIMILVAATLYGFGKTFFWPTMLGVVAERFPKGGALTLNVMGGIGMLSVGVFGTQLTGYLTDTRIVDRLGDQTNLVAIQKPELEAARDGLETARPALEAKINSTSDDEARRALENDLRALSADLENTQGALARLEQTGSGPALLGEVKGDEKTSIFGKYESIAKNKLTDRINLYNTYHAFVAAVNANPELAGRDAAVQDQDPSDDELAKIVVRQLPEVPETATPEETATKEGYRKAVVDFRRALLAAYDNNVENPNKAATDDVRYRAVKQANLLVDEATFQKLNVDNKIVSTVEGSVQKAALMNPMAIFPVIMLVCYLLLIAYFRAKGGYKAEVLAGHAADDAEFTGGTEGPGEG